eukprot:scaffold240551_cov67-Attheya_sp.AAC.3
MQEAVRNVKEYLGCEYDGHTLLKSAPMAFVKDYRPELEISEELGSEEASYDQSQIGILRSMVELGSDDIITEVSMLATQMAMPRQGHLETIFHIYAYLDKKHNSTMVFDLSYYPEIDHRSFKDCEWKNFYGNVNEALSTNAPTAVHGKEVDKQATVESSVFGAEFVAMKVGMETCHESVLKKKSNSICYHAIRESVAMGESLTTHVPMALNPADMCTKVISGGKKRDDLTGLEYTLCPSLLCNTAYMQGAGGEAPARIICYA